MLIEGLIAKVAATVVTGAVGAVAYDALRRTVAKAPLRGVAVSAAAVGLRGVRKAEDGAESARLSVADVVAEARERLGEEAPPPGVTGGGHDHDHDH
jgi:type IV secretory pathway TrbL component